MNPHQIVEAVLFASDAPITADEIARADEHLDEDQVELAIRQLQAEYDDAERSFQVMEVAEGYQIMTRSEFAPYLERFDNVPRPSRLSGPALETLAIIAYRQPLGRMEIEYIRGVGAQGVLRTLQDREMIEVVGRAEGLGRPVLYGTTKKFLEHFGLKSLEDLPHPEELPIVLRERIPLGPEEAEEAEASEDAEASQESEGTGEAAEVGEAGEPGEAVEAGEGEGTGDTGDAGDTGDTGDTGDAGDAVETVESAEGAEVGDVDEAVAAEEAEEGDGTAPGAETPETAEATADEPEVAAEEAQEGDGAPPAAEAPGTAEAAEATADEPEVGPETVPGDAGEEEESVPGDTPDDDRRS